MPTARLGSWYDQAVAKGLIRPGALAAPPALPPDPSERQFQAAVVAEARRLEWACYHTFNSRRSAAGFPDLVMLRAGRLIVAELKVRRNKTTPAQELWLFLFGLVPGVRVRRWRPEHWPAIVAELGGEV